MLRGWFLKLSDIHASFAFFNYPMLCSMVVNIGWRDECILCWIFYRFPALPWSKQMMVKNISHGIAGCVQYEALNICHDPVLDPNLAACVASCTRESISWTQKWRQENQPIHLIHVLTFNRIHLLQLRPVPHPSSWSWPRYNITLTCRSKPDQGSRHQHWLPRLLFEYIWSPH